MLIMIVVLFVYAVALVSFSSTINSWPRWVQLPFYIIAGVAWVFPLKPVIDWMNAEPVKDSEE